MGKNEVDRMCQLSTEHEKTMAQRRTALRESATLLYESRKKMLFAAASGNPSEASILLEHFITEEKWEVEVTKYALASRLYVVFKTAIVKAIALLESAETIQGQEDPQIGVSKARLKLLEGGAE